jgi:hypothetical protein
METYEIVITGLSVIIVAMMSLTAWITGKSIEATRGSIPAELTPVLELLVLGGLHLSRRTETEVDDAAMERVARSLGYEVSFTEAGIVLKRAPTMRDVTSRIYGSSAARAPGNVGGRVGVQDGADFAAINAERGMIPGAKETDLQEAPKGPVEAPKG